MSTSKPRGIRVILKNDQTVDFPFGASWGRPSTGPLSILNADGRVIAEVDQPSLAIVSFISPEARA